MVKKCPLKSDCLGSNLASSTDLLYDLRKLPKSSVPLHQGDDCTYLLCFSEESYETLRMVWHFMQHAGTH